MATMGTRMVCTEVSTMVPELSVLNVSLPSMVGRLSVLHVSSS